MEEEFDPFIEKKEQNESNRDRVLTKYLSSFGNHEVKGLLYASMQEGILYTNRDLYKAIIDNQGQIPVWRMGHLVPSRYVERSLVLIGDVVALYQTQKTKYFYKKPDPIAEGLNGHLLNFSENHDISLINLLGYASSNKQDERIDTKKQGPLTRYHLFELLISKPDSLRQIDLVTSLKTGQGIISTHLKNLATKGVITYESVGGTDLISHFYPPSKHLIFHESIYKKNSALTEDIVSIVNPYFPTIISSLSVYNELLRKYPYRNKWDRESLQAEVSRILSKLENIGYLKRVKFCREARSEVTLTKIQRKTLENFVAIIDTGLEANSSFIKEGKEIANEIINNPSRFNALLIKAKKSSSYI